MRAKKLRFCILARLKKSARPLGRLPEQERFLMSFLCYVLSTHLRFRSTFYSVSISLAVKPVISAISLTS